MVDKTKLQEVKAPEVKEEEGDKFAKLRTKLDLNQSNHPFVAIFLVLFKAAPIVLYESYINLAISQCMSYQEQIQ